MAHSSLGVSLSPSDPKYFSLQIHSSTSSHNSILARLQNFISLSIIHYLIKNKLLCLPPLTKNPLHLSILTLYYYILQLFALCCHLTSFHLSPSPPTQDKDSIALCLLDLTLPFLTPHHHHHLHNAPIILTAPCHDVMSLNIFHPRLLTHSHHISWHARR